MLSSVEIAVACGVRPVPGLAARFLRDRRASRGSLDSPPRCHLVPARQVAIDSVLPENGLQ